MSTAGQAVYDKVFRITHHEPSEVMDFVRITTSSGEVLEVSPTHTVHVGRSRCQLKLNCGTEMLCVGVGGGGGNNTPTGWWPPARGLRATLPVNTQTRTHY